jgi:hypothetical protein
LVGCGRRDWATGEGRKGKVRKGKKRMEEQLGEERRESRLMLKEDR